MRKALMIVDMLVDFIDESGTLYCGPSAEKIVPFVKNEIERFRRDGGTIIHLTDSHRRNDREFKMFPAHCVSGTRGARIIDELKPGRGDIIIRKPTISCFYRTRLEGLLKGNRIKRVTVMGVCTSICVMDAVADLSCRGYEVTVHRKGVADFDPKFHKFALERISKTYGAEVI